MARKNSGGLGSWEYGNAPAQGSAGTGQCSDSGTAANFIRGISDASEDPISQYEVPSLSGSTIKADVCPGVWGRNSKKP